MLYPRVEHQAVLAVVVVVVGPLVVHPYHPFRDAVRLLRQPAVFIVAVVEHADDPETMQEVLYPVLADFFKPALLARMEVVPYLPLSKETLATIIAGKLARLDNVLRSRFGAEVVIDAPSGCP